MDEELEKHKHYLNVLAKHDSVYQPEIRNAIAYAIATLEELSGDQR